MKLLEAISQQYRLNLENWELLQETDDLVYKIIDDCQQTYTVKIHRKQLSRTDDKLSDLCDWLDFLSETVSFNFPLPLRNLNGSFQSQIQDESGTIYDFVVYRWVDGKPISKQLDRQNIQKMGALMAELHNASSQYDRKATALDRYDGKWIHNCSSIILNGAKTVGYTARQLHNIDRAKFRQIEKFMNLSENLSNQSPGFRSGNMGFNPY